MGMGISHNITSWDCLYMVRTWPATAGNWFPRRKNNESIVPSFHKFRKTCSISSVRRCRFELSVPSEVTALIKQDIVHHVIERTGLPRTKAEAAVDTVFEGLKQALAAGERIELRGFGVFSVRARKTGIGRNPRTGTEVSITPGKAVRFKPGKELHTLETGKTSA
jgi:nucleoid DNA-binding protein